MCKIRRGINQRSVKVEDDAAAPHVASDPSGSVKTRRARDEHDAVGLRAALGGPRAFSLGLLQGDDARQLPAL